MPTLEELRNTRIEKLNELKKEGINPYPSKVKREISIKSAVDNFWLHRFARKEFYLAGRVKTIREHGKAAFFDIEDGAGKIQVFINPKDLSKKGYEKFLNYFDVGDFVEVRGKFFKTKKGEKTLRANKARIITKSIRPLPEKWHGLKDIEERYRKRYLDLLMNPEIKKKFLMRSKIIKELRNFLDNEKFSEFETPILQNIPGGATARPFITRLNALDMGLYLRIAPELYLKRLLIGGFEKVYEIGRNFRNEGMDATHNPEFTMLEAYIAYKDSDYLKTFLQELFSFLAKKFNSKMDFEQPWQEKDYDDLIKKYGDFSAQDGPAQPKADQPWAGSGWELAKKDLIQPTFVSGFPGEILPLSKTLEKDPARADAFQIIAGGLELVKAFTEENNPLEQRRRFEEQEKLRATGEEEAQRLDEDFLEALEYGMPPCAGFGLGIDRLAMLLTNSHTAREVILFPTMKPKE